MSDKPKNPPILEVVKGAKKSGAAGNHNSGRSGGSGGGGSGSQDKPIRFGEYGIVGRQFVQYRMMKVDSSGDRQEGYFVLCDFTAEIIEEVHVHNGLESECLLSIRGDRANGKPLEPVQISAKAFYGSQKTFANDAWGARVLIMPGATKATNVMTAILLYSRRNGDIPSRNVYKHCGWVFIDDRWQFLHAGGAINQDGLNAGIQVELNGNMGKYRLPEPVSGEALKSAVSSALRLLTVCPNKPSIGAALLIMAIRGPLNEALPLDMVCWLYGLTGSRKSSIAGVALSFFGAEFYDGKSLPGNWSSSGGALEMQAFRAKDLGFVVDDYKAVGSNKHDDDLKKRCDNFIRNTGNAAGRDTLTQTRDLRQSAYNRSAAIITGEDMPTGISILGRSLTLELARNDVENSILSELQSSAAAGVLASVMASYIQWLAPRIDQLKKDFPVMVAQMRDAAIRDNLCPSHPRAPQNYANMVAAAEVFTDFLQDAGVMDGMSANALLGTIETGLQAAFMEQMSYAIEQDEPTRFFELLRSALSSGEAYIADKNNQGPPKVRPHAWGWSKSAFGVSSDVFNPNGARIGWFVEPRDGEPSKVFLDKETAFRVAQQIASAQRQPFHAGSMSALWRMMMHRNIIEPDTSDPKRQRPDPRKKIEGIYRRVLVFKSDLLAPPANDNDD